MRAEWLKRIQGLATLAPMAGASDFVFRLLCREMGCPMATTEMVSAKGYLMAGGRPAVRELLLRAPQETLALQLFGHDPHEMAEAARRLEEGYCAIDINMGCPAPKITGNGDGSALMQSPDIAAAIVRSVKAAVSLPVTVKMRIGWDENSRNAVPFAMMLRDAGADALTVHGRTRQRQYAGEADWDAIAEVVSAVDIPVIGNGDVRDYESMRAMLAHTGCYAAAIGRAALGNPWIFEQIITDGKASPPSPRQRMAMCARHACMLCAQKGERVAIREMRTHAAYYLRGLRDAAAIRRHVQAACTLAELRHILCAAEE